jgi:cupin fold WbuC family metalloprotein
MKIIDQQLLQKLTQQAATSPRLRSNLNLHEDLEEPVQRFLNAMEPGTYVRPHRHHQPPRWELFVVMSGKAALLTFDESGKVTERLELEAGGHNQSVEIPAGDWLTILPLQTGTVLFEFKEGPYIQPSDNNFADWAPSEGDPRCSDFIQWLEQASVGDAW